MKYVYENHYACKFRAKLGSNEIRRNFSWDNAARVASMHIQEFNEESKGTVLVPPPEDEEVKVINHFVDGAFVEIKGNSSKKFLVTLTDQKENTVEYEKAISINNWVKSGKKYYVDWLCQVRDQDGVIIHKHKFDAKGKKVFISFESRSLGDTLAWIPYVELFRVKNKCKVIVSTFWNHILNEAYSQYKFVQPGHIEKELYAMYRIGVETGNKNINKNDWRTIPLQKIAADILGVSDKEIQPKVNPFPIPDTGGRKFVSISEASTAGCKQWQHPGGWQTVVDFLNNEGYNVVVVSREPTELKNIINQTNQSIQTTIKNIGMSEFFMGVSSGPSWLAWALDKPVVLISGCTKEWNEFSCTRIINKKVCHGCMNDEKFVFDRGDWWWCPTK
jgi:autotransporter strand-loop-strand O-heptosyltransferase